MRKYQRIWEELKKNKIASITAPVDSHRRIIQAVRKEKCSDTGWIFLLQETGTTYRLMDKKIGNTIEFHLIDITVISSKLYTTLIK